MKELTVAELNREIMTACADAHCISGALIHETKVDPEAAVAAAKQMERAARYLRRHVGNEK